jgi:hypothetical protein
MHIRQTCWALAITLFCFSARAIEGGPAAAQPRSTSNRIVVIVAASFSLRDVSKALLRRIFLGEPSLHEGTKLVPITAPTGDVMRVAFDRAALGFTQSDSGRYWVDRRIRGQGLPPRSIPNQPLVRAVVAKLPGAVGYISATQLDATVRAVTVDGVPYTDPKYALAVE